MSDSFYPVIASRSSQPLAGHRLLFQINHDQTAIHKLEEQLSTGRRINKASEDPSAAIRALAAQRQLEYKGQLLENIKSAQTVLTASETSLAQSQSILNEMRGLTVNAADNTNSPEERQAMLAQIDAAISKLVDIGNTKLHDQYLFSGSRVGRPPLDIQSDSIAFTGTRDELQTFTDFASMVAANITANDAFGVRSSRVVGRVDLNPTPSLNTRISELNGGQGVNLSGIVLSDGSTTIEVDLSNAFTLDDIKRAIEAEPLGTRDLLVSVVGNGLQIDYTDGLGGILRVNESGAGLAAAELGILTSVSTSTAPVVGTDLNPIVTPATPLSQLLDGSGITIGSSFRLQQGNRTYTIATNGMSTVEDLINGIHRTGANVIAEIDSNGQHLTLQSVESGTTLSIGENGSNLASALGIRTFDTATLVSDLNFGQGIFTTDTGPDLRITRTDGSLLQINLDGVQTVGDVLDRINNHVDNFAPALRVVASLATTGNGLVLTAVSGTQQISVSNPGGSQAAIGLGLVPRGSIDAVGVASGTNSVIQGTDVSGVEVEGAFTSLFRFKEAIDSNNFEDIERIAQAIDDDLLRMSLARGVMGARQQSLDSAQQTTDDQIIQLTEVESNELDADLAKTISDLTARQAALQASLQLMGNINQLTLFNYI